jgi:hypothetical protein
MYYFSSSLCLAQQCDTLLLLVHLVHLLLVPLDGLFVPLDLVLVVLDFLPVVLDFLPVALIHAFKLLLLQLAEVLILQSFLPLAESTATFADRA